MNRDSLYRSFLDALSAMQLRGLLQWQYERRANADEYADAVKRIPIIHDEFRRRAISPTLK